MLSWQGEKSRAAKRGGFPESRSGLVLPFLSYFVLFCPFWDFPDFSGIFPICSGMVRGFSRFVPFLFLGLFRARTRNSPERLRDTIWTFPEKSGKPPGLETPRLSFSQKKFPPKFYQVFPIRYFKIQIKFHQKTSQCTSAGIATPKSCRETISVSQLSRNCPHRGSNFERGKEAPSCGRETV